MYVLFHVEALLCFIFTLYIYFRYAMKDLRLYVILLNILVWFLTFVTAFIIPFDIQLNSRIINQENTQLIEEEKTYFKILYFVIYWTIYILSWIIIPVAQEYEKAGDFTSQQRLKRAIKTNLYMYLIIIVLGIVFIIYLIVKQQLTGQKLISFLILLSNAWGLFLVIFLLGYGLVAVPKHVLKLADYKTRIKYLEFCAAEAKSNLEDRNYDLISCAQKIKSVRSILDSDNSNPNRGFIEKIWLDLNLTTLKDSIVEEELQSYSKKFTYEDLITLNQTIKINKNDIIRLKWYIYFNNYFSELDEIYKEWYHLQTLLGLLPNGYNYNKNIWTRVLKYYYINIKPWILRILAFFLIMMSLGTLVSEITLFSNIPLSIFGFLIEKSENIYVLNILILIPLIFTFITSLYGLFNLKLSGFFSIHDNRLTDSSSLLFLSGFMCRIGFPVCLNFVQILKLRNVNTVIEFIMGETPDVGKNFMIFFPAILIILCLFNLFDIYGRFMNILGFNTFGFKNSQTDDKIEEGNEVLMKIRMTYERDARMNEDYNSINNKNSDLNSNLISNDIKMVVKKY